MSRIEWIVCERSRHWSTALSTALGRADWTPRSVPRLFEVRQLSELTTRLDARPDSLAVVEVQRANLSDALVWLAEAGRLYPLARFAALAERELCASVESGPASRPGHRQPVIDALREAGAGEVVTSPRQLQGILALGRRHASLRAVRHDSPPADTSIAAWVWQSLPWQDE